MSVTSVTTEDHTNVTPPFLGDRWKAIDASAFHYLDRRNRILAILTLADPSELQ